MSYLPRVPVRFIPEHAELLKSQSGDSGKGKYDHINFKPPQAVANAAARGLEYRKKASPSNRGGLTAEEAGKQGIGSGVQRAVNLKNRDEVSPQTISKMVAFFSRHEKNKSVDAENKSTPWNDKGYVAWLLWGGDPGKSWAEKIKAQMDKADGKGDSMNKSMEVLSGGTAGEGTDWTETEPQLTVPEGVVPQFRAPGDRNIGNVLFRRNPDGTLDLDAAKHVVVDIIHKVKDKLPLTELEKMVLGVLMPLVFDFVDPRLAGPMMAVHLRLAPWEIVLINEKVSAHLIAEMSYNAGIGGGGDPGRATARS